MSNEAQRLYRSLNEQAQGHADQLLKYAWERDQATAQRDALLAAAKAMLTPCRSQAIYDERRNALVAAIAAAESNEVSA